MTRSPDHRSSADEPYLLAIDGGNSKTDIAILATDGTVLSRVRTGGSCHQRIGLSGTLQVIRDGVGEAKRAAGVTGSAAVAMLCLAGLDLPVDDDAVLAALAPLPLADRLELRNDTFAVMRAGAPHGWGIALVCGAGMNCVGQDPSGKRVRFPALGDISGDWAAGGGWLGMKALGAAVRAADGRGPRTILEDLVPEHFGMPTAYAVMEAVYTGALDHAELTMLSPLVFRACAAGEEWACRVRDELADEIVANVTAAIERLSLADVELDVVVGGGVFANDDIEFHGRIERGVTALASNAVMRRLDDPPITGAALLALDAYGGSPQAEERARAMLKRLSRNHARVPSPATSPVQHAL